MHAHTLTLLDGSHSEQEPNFFSAPQRVHRLILIQLLSFLSFSIWKWDEPAYASCFPPGSGSDEIMSALLAWTEGRPPNFQRLSVSRSAGQCHNGCLMTWLTSEAWSEWEGCVCVWGGGLMTVLHKEQQGAKS